MSLKKTASYENPHAIFADKRDEWEWRVLKCYKAAKSEERDQYARWFCGVSSPYTFGGYDLGDTYRAEVLRYGALVAATDEWVTEHLGNVRGSLPTPAEYLAKSHSS